MKNLKLDKELLQILGKNGQRWFRYYDFRDRHSFKILFVKYLFAIAVIVYVAWRMI